MQSSQKIRQTDISQKSLNRSLKLENINPVNAGRTKLSTTLKQLVGNSRGIVWLCLTILWVGA